MLNPWENDAFSMASLTDAINIIPNNYGKIGAMNLMPVKGVRTRTIMVEEKNGVLNLITSKPPGSPGAQNETGKRKVRSFVIPHLPLDDTLLPDEYEGVRAFGTENELAPYVAIMNDKLQTMKNKHAITLEHLRMGALKGVILDGDGSTLYDLYSEFEISQKIVPFTLGSSTTKVRTKCLAVSRHIEANLMGETMSGVRVECSEGFFDNLIEHDNVKAAYANYAEAEDRLGGDPRKGFKFGGLVFSEYIGNAPDADGVSRKFIADGEAHAYPTGTMSTFSTYVAPADFVETANTIGLPFYAKQEPRKFNRGVDLHTQSNPLPLCKRPGILVKLTAA
ncbi:major capsid protein [Desulfoluna spongiiphila]|uniref:major capsid protein n=1 Tax=Desulfoluna spongiiphila TaxID=419481 RepID=UPI0012557EDA|nr:major capsid protein [Desulfoluna spongiiphila]VVS95350.1 major capsid protein gpe [Desulfoluna spongiiphila]